MECFTRILRSQNESLKVDQASYFRIMIRTGRILSEIAESLGYEVENIDLFRTRIATATKEHLREEVVILHWSGDRKLERH
jgi:hypothetical protein